MTFPTTRSAIGNVQGTNSSSWTLSYPSSSDILDGGANAIEAGDLILVTVSRDGTSGTQSISGFSTLLDAAGSACKGGVFVKVADGTESGTFTYTPGASEQGVWRIAVIKNWYGAISGGVEVSSTASGTATTPSTNMPDPPSFSPAWGSADTYWRTCAATDDGRTGVTAWPTNYDIYAYSDASGGSGGATLGSVGRTNATATENPSAFTINRSVAWIAWTTAVRPDSSTKIAVGERAVALTGQAPSAFVAHQSSPDVRAVGIQGYAPSVFVPVVMEPGAGAVSIEGQTPTRGTIIGTDTGAVALAGLTPNARHDSIRTPAQAQIVLAGNAPDSVISTFSRPDAGAISILGQEPAALVTMLASPANAEISLVGQSPSIQLELFVHPDAGAITLQGHAPAASGNIIVTPDAGAITIQGETPIRQLSEGDIERAPDAGTITIQGATPTVVALAPVVLSLSDNIPAGSTGPTAARLDPPSGKTGSNFSDGWISDDTNPLADVDIQDGGYTELEWSIKLTDAADGAYEFRVVADDIPLDVYTLTPQISISTDDKIAYPATGTITLVGRQPALALDVAVPAGAISIAPQQPTRVEGSLRSTGAAALVITGYAPSVYEGSIRQPASGTITLSGQTPARIEESYRRPDAGTVTVAGQAPFWIDRAWYQAQTLTINTGSVASGSLDDTWSAQDGGAMLVLNENTGVGPAFDYEFTFNTLPTFAPYLDLGIIGYYEGSPAHTVEVQCWHDGGWHLLGTLPPTSSPETYWFRLPVVQSSYTIRIVHTSNGSAGHYLHIDQIAIWEFVAGVGAAHITITGQTPTRVEASNRLPDAGSIQLAGYAPTLREESIRQPGAGTVTISGQTPVRVEASIREPGAGTIAIAGQAPTRIEAITISIPAGTIALAGRSPNFATDVAVGAGTISIQRLAPTRITAHNIDVGLRALTLTGRAPTLDVGLGVPAGAVTLAGKAPAASQDIIRATPAGAVTFTGEQPAAHLDLVIAVPAGSVAVEGRLPSLVLFGTVAPDRGVITIQGYAPTLAGDRVALPQAGAITLAGAAPGLGLAVGETTGQIAIAGHAPALRFDLVAAVPAGGITLQGHAPLAATGFATAVDAGQIQILGYEPTFALTTNTTIGVPAGAIGISGHAPEVLATGVILWAAADGPSSFDAYDHARHLWFDATGGTTVRARVRVELEADKAGRIARIGTVKCSQQAGSRASTRLLRTEHALVKLGTVSALSAEFVLLDCHKVEVYDDELAEVLTLLEAA